MIKTTNINGHDITWEVTGEGYPVFFVHGFGEDKSVWDDFIDPFTGIYQVIRPDLPGFGDSPAWEGVSISDFAAVIKGIFDELQLEKCIIVGHSMGGYATLAFAEQHASLLEGIGLFHSHPYADTEAKKEGRQQGIDFLEKHGAGPFVRQLVPKLFGEKARDKFSSTIDKMIQRGIEAGQEGLIEALKAMQNRPDRSKVLAKASVPVLFVIGKEDELVPWEYSSNQTPLPKVASIHILEGIGHAGMHEAKAETQEMVGSFLEFCLRED
ncbi:MAG: alpha/beta hydrolase [Bacteroidota bacterium]